MFEVEVADDVLTAQVVRSVDNPVSLGSWDQPLLFLVRPGPPTGDAGGAAMVSAAAAAAERFALIDAAGRERPGAWAAASSTVETIEPCVLADGVVVGAYSEEALTPAQADTMLRVLVGELYSHRVGAHVGPPPVGTVAEDLPEAPLPAEGPGDATPDGEQAPKRWFVQRGVRATTTTGEGYIDLEWLLPDGGWSRQHGLARSWENQPEPKAEMVALVVELRKQADAAPDPAHTEVNGVLLNPGDDDSTFPRPPAAIRDHGHQWDSA